MYQIGDTILFDLNNGGRMLGRIRNTCGFDYFTEMIVSNKCDLSYGVYSPFNHLVIGKVVGNRIVNRGDGL